mmetsp:Transcript_6764/g.21025  ORF Transcript_6764/g.21025 Transcript_6764/m.21025 type:complete len:207 (+) Transcript_6764:668-1288(+)
MSRLKVALRSGWVTWAFFMRRPVGLMKRSYLGGFLVKLSSTKVTLLTTRFHDLRLRLPVDCTRNISSSATGLTFGIGTLHLPAFSARFCFTVFDRIFARDTPSRSSKNAGKAPSSALSSLRARASFSSCSAIVLRIVAFSLKRLRLWSLARMPCTFRANVALSCTSRASFFRFRSGASNRSPCRFRCCSMYSCCGIPWWAGRVLGR